MRRLIWIALLAACGGTTRAPDPPPPAGPDLFHNLLLTAADCTTPPQPAVSRDVALADLAVVERILRTGYAGFDELAREGLDWDALFDRARDELEAWEEPVGVADFRSWLLEQLSPARDNHLSFFDFGPLSWSHWGSTGVHEDAYVADVTFVADPGGWLVREGAAPVGARLASCAGYAPAEIVRPSLDDELRPVGRIVLLSVDPPAPLACRFAVAADDERIIELPLRDLRVGPEDDDDGATFERRDGNVVVLRVRDLDSARRNELEPFVATAVELRTARAILLDLRGNRGGSDDYVTRWFTDLTAGELHYSVIEELRSDVTWQGQANHATCSLARPGLDDGVRAELKERRRAVIEAIDRRVERTSDTYRDWDVRTPTTQGTAPQPFAGALVLLVDRDCASSCESFVTYARQIPDAKIVGENTGGMGVFGDVLTYRLPGTGLGMSAGSKWFHGAGPALTAPEGRGFLPDFWLDTDRAPELAERLAACLTRPDCADELRLR
jgi:hypothetical protein